MCLLRYALLKNTYDNSQKASLIDFWKKCITGWTHLDLKVCQEKDHGAHKIFHFNKNMRSTLMQGSIKYKETTYLFVFLRKTMQITILI